MTAPAQPRTFTPAERQAIRVAARYELARRSFVDFLRFCVVESDDPVNPGPISFEPYDYQLERATAWERGDSEVNLKARQMGYSWLLAMYKLWVASWTRGGHVGYYSRTLDEARWQIDRRVEYIWNHLPSELQVKYRKRDTLLEFENGGSIRAFPSTEDAGIGYTFRLVVADEAAFHQHGATNYAAYRPTISAGGQLIICSTADPTLGPHGFFHDMWEGAVAGQNGYTPVFVPWYARPGRDEAWLARERAAYEGMPDMFDAYYPASAAEAFVGRTGLVYPQFSIARHVKPAPVPWDQCLYRWGCYDLGGGDPNAAVAMGVYKTKDGQPRVGQYGEFYKRGNVGVDEFGAWFHGWHGQAPFTRIEPDPAPGGVVVASSLRKLGLPVGEARYKRGEGLGIQAMFLDNDWLTIDPSCVNGIKEFGGYRWLEKTDPNSKDRYATSTPVDNHADEMDARRGALMGIYKTLMAGGARKMAFSGVDL